MTNPHYQAFPDGENEGLTKREYFAIMALQGNLAACSASYPDIEAVTTKSVEYADALIEKLNKTEK